MSPALPPDSRPPARRRALALLGCALAPAATWAAPPGPAGSAPATPAAAPPLKPPPTYATRLPAAGRLEYALRSGLMRGTGLFQWSRTADGYRATLEGHVFGLSVLNWTSEGEVDRHGLAPRRFTDQRLNRAPRIAHFQRDSGRITYEGRDTVRPLPPGAQDRLSWMVQAPAILLADPALQAPGRRILLYVSGARADAAVWTFEVRGREAVDLPAGRIEDALHLRRVPDEPDDTRAEAWLDPARGLLPVRARFSSADGREVTDFLLAR